MNFAAAMLRIALVLSALLAPSLARADADIFLFGYTLQTPGEADLYC